MRSGSTGRKRRCTLRHDNPPEQDARRFGREFDLTFFLLVVHAEGATADVTPVIPIGLDAYRRWEDWPLLRIGVRAYVRSNYDRKGGNERADASHYLYQLAEDKNVTLDVAGAGYLYFARYNHWHGSPWIYEVDGTAHTVSETSTENPQNPDANSHFLPAHLLPSPLTWMWAQTTGADLMGVPIGFEQSLRMMYGRTYYGTGYYIYHLIDRAAPARDLVDIVSFASGVSGSATAASDNAGGDTLGFVLRGLG